jgi:localization factor PodJL
MKLGVPWSHKLKGLKASMAQSTPESGAVHQRLDDLTRQLERLSKITEGRFGQKTAPAVPTASETAPVQRPQPSSAGLEPPDAAAAAAATRPSSEARSLDKESGRAVDTRPLKRGMLRPTYSGNDEKLDTAIAEIVARQHVLDDERATATRPDEASPPRDLPTQDLSGLDRHLRHITEQIESLRRPLGIEDIAPGLRQELSAISRSLSEAMPREAIEAVEAEVRNLADRLDQRRQSGMEESALAAIEQSLADIRDTLQSLRPAESLVGFPSAIEKLARKIDSIAAAHNDPAVLQQLESAITGLRSIVAHVASDDALGRLTEEVRGLALRVEEIADANTRSGQMPAEVEDAVRDLSDKIERLQLGPGDAIAFGQLEDRIARLVEKLDASGARLGHIETLERGLADVLVHLEAQRSRGMLGGSDIPIESLKRDLETTNAMLSSIVERLASIESGIRGAGRGWAAPWSSPSMPPAPQLGAGKTASREAWSPAQTEAPSPSAVSPGERNAATTQFPHWPVAPAREHRPIDPSLPPDHPLEPGYTGRPRAAQSPVDRVAAAEGPARPSSGADAAGRADFIAAARRAAQAAAQTASNADNDPGHERGEKHSIGERLSDKMRSLLVGSSVVAVTLGAFHVATVMVGTPDGAPQPAKVAEVPAKHSPAKKFAARLTDPTPIGALGDDAPVTEPSSPAPSLSTSPAAPSAKPAAKPAQPEKL